MKLSSDTQGKPVVLVGFMASGKSTVGLLLAERLKVPFFDTDRLIEEEFGMTIAKIFQEKGEPFFRQAERERITGLLSPGLRIVAAGGGAFIDPVTRATLAAQARTIWLDPPLEVIQTRLANDATRPLAAERNAQQLRALWIERRALYAQANLRIDNSSGTAVSVDTILAGLALP